MDHFDSQDVERVVALLGRLSDPNQSLGILESKKMLVDGIRELIDADFYCMCTSVINQNRGDDSMYNQLLDGGWQDDAERDRFYELVMRYEVNKYTSEYGSTHQPRLNHVTFFAVDCLTDPDFQQQYLTQWNAAGFGHGILSMYNVESEVVSGIGLHRRLGRPDFTKRELGIVHLVFQQVRWLHEDSLQAPAGKSVIKLTPRERRTLILMMGGDSLKQIASKMEISRSTVDTYVKNIYRQLGVNSRPELMAQFTSGGRSTNIA